MMSNAISKKVFEVIGAGEIRIGADAESICGDRAGFTFAVSWGKYGFAGGVLNRDQAKALAEHILSVLNSPELKPEKKVFAEWRKSLREF